ncbi:MAG: hypothetical protein ABTQ26_03375 [Azonexus sp.]
MTRKPSKKAPISFPPDIDWHDNEKPSPRKKKKSKPTPSQRLATMSELVQHLGQPYAEATTADIANLQILARGEDIDIASLEI